MNSYLKHKRGLINLLLKHNVASDPSELEKKEYKLSERIYQIPLS
jgi:hypothetical protein